MSKQTKNKWNNECRFHSGDSKLSVEGKRKGVKFVVCRTCGATGPYGNNEVEAIRRWYEGVSTDEIGQDNINSRPSHGESISSDTRGIVKSRGGSR